MHPKFKCIPSFTPAIRFHTCNCHPAFLLPSLFAWWSHTPRCCPPTPGMGKGVAAWSLPSQKIIYRILQPSHLQVTAPVANTGGRGQSLPCLLLQETPPEAQQHLLSVVASSERQRGGRGGGIVSLWVFTSLAVVLKIYYFHSSAAAPLAFCREVIGLLSIRDTE